jgi:EAL domain-containing protein (putative c-di-GMP-specific phosphodiesterase class I)/PAS domain-containing protein
LAELKDARARRSPLRRALQRLLPYLTALAVLVLCALLLFAVYFTQLELPWVSFLAGVLVAAVIALVTRVSRSEWRVARRAAQLARVRERLAAETERRARAENALATTREKVELIDARLPLPLAYVDAELQLRYHNQAFRERLGLRPAALERGLLPAVLAESGYAELEPAINAALAGRATSLPWRVRGGEASGRTLVAHCAPHAGATGATLGCFLTITEPAAGAPADAAPADADAGAESPPEEALSGWSSPVEFLESALQNNEFRLYGQKILALREDGRERLEVLIRLAEEEENMMPPGAFFPVAERYGLMPQLDRWVVEHVLAWVAAGGASGRRHDGQYFINLAAATVQDASFAAFVREALQRRSLPGNLLVFEVDARGAESHLAAAAALAAELKRLGCALALAGLHADRAAFDLVHGTPMDVLRRIAPDFLKVDGSLVLAIRRDKVARARVVAINRIAHGMKIRTIAEFVESDDILAALRSIGVDFAQGFGISVPAPLRNSA